MRGREGGGGGEIGHFSLGPRWRPQQHYQKKSKYCNRTVTNQEGIQWIITVGHTAGIILALNLLGFDFENFSVIRKVRI